MGFPHALVLPYPLQGHVIPLMELSHCLVDHGFKITFVNTEFNHDRVVAALSKKQASEMDHIQLVSVPDGMDSRGDRNNLGELTESMLQVMPGCLEELIRKTNESGGDKITYMIADQNMGWALNVAKKVGLRAAAFWPAAAGQLTSLLSIPKLIEDGIIESTTGIPKKGTVSLGQGIPSLETAQFTWNCFGDSKTRQIVFNYVFNNTRATEIAELIVCNSFNEIELPVFTNMPKLLPIGPLLTNLHSGKSAGNFWTEDSTCTAWLDEQSANSVIYVAFGSFTIFDQRQFQELALGLELTGRPFLWVVRPNITDELSSAYPSGFQERVAGRGRLVGWSPQQKVLAHPSVACFLSHCGWNSTMDGVTYGVPFLCWPYFADQFLNQNYICDTWKTGLKVTPDEKGFISKEEIMVKVEELLSSAEIRNKAQALKVIAQRNVQEGGASYENFITFVEGMKQ